MICRRSAKSTAIALAATVGLFAQVQTAQARSEILTVAGGCFWCAGSDFESVDDLKEPNSTYNQVVLVAQAMPQQSSQATPKPTPKMTSKPTPKRKRLLVVSEPL